MQLSDHVGRRMKLQDLYVLTAVVQAGSMRKAAAHLNTTQPSISRSIAELERTFGVQLLDRNPQGVAPTEYGRALLDGGATVFDELRQTVKNIEFLAHPEAGDVRIGCIPRPGRELCFRRRRSALSALPAHHISSCNRRERHAVP